MKLLKDNDASLAPLSGKTVAVLGYGNQGRAQALNLRDSGVSVIVGNRDDDYREQAVRDGFEPVSIADAAAAGDFLLVLTTDESQPLIWAEQIAPGIRPDAPFDDQPVRHAFARAEADHRRDAAEGAGVLPARHPRRPVRQGMERRAGLGRQAAGRVAPPRTRPPDEPHRAWRHRGDQGGAFRIGVRRWALERVSEAPPTPATPSAKPTMPRTMRAYVVY